MIPNVPWEELYRAALLELRPEELKQRIEVAEKAIQSRIIELRLNDISSLEESRALDDALRGLRVLAGMECKRPQSTSSSSGSVQNEVKS